jgi:hypothetical protein
MDLNSIADAKQKFRIRFRIRIRSKVSFGFGSGFESGFESRIRIQIRTLDSDLDQKLAKTSFFFVLKFLPSLIFKHKKAPSLSSVTWLRTRFAINLQDSDPDLLVSKRHGSADPDPYQKVTDSQHCAHLLENVFDCTAIVATTWYVHITIRTTVPYFSLKIRLFFRFFSDPVSVPDSYPDPNPDPKRLFRFRIGSGSGQKFRILQDPVPDPQHWIWIRL